MDQINTVMLKTFVPTVGQNLVQLGNMCCARFALLAILCIALQIHWVDPWLHLYMCKHLTCITMQQSQIQNDSMSVDVRLNSLHRHH